MIEPTWRLDLWKTAHHETIPRDETWIMLEKYGEHVCDGFVDWDQVRERLEDDYGASVHENIWSHKGGSWWHHVEFPSQQELVRFTLTWG